MKYNRKKHKQAIQVALLSISLLQHKYATNNTEKNADIGYTNSSPGKPQHYNKRKQNSFIIICYLGTRIMNIFGKAYLGLFCDSYQKLQAM